MSDQDDQSGWRYPDEEFPGEFAWTRITPETPRTNYPPPFEVFFIQVKTGPDTRYGLEANIDPIGFFRRRIPEMGLPDDEDVRAQLLRINAEVPANAHWVSLVATVGSHSATNVAILHYKEHRDDDYAQS